MNSAELESKRMQPSSSQVSYLQRILRRIGEREAVPTWSLLLAVFVVVAYAILWIAGQALVVTVSGGDFSIPTSGILVFGASLGSLVSAAGVLQWARRRMGKDWINGLRLRHPINPSVFVIVLTGLGTAWAIDLIGLLLKLKGDQILPPILDSLRGPITAAWIAAAVFALLIQPFAEGLIFYGLLFPVIARDFGNNWLAAFIVAVIYTILNAAIFNVSAGTWFLLIQPFLMAMVVGLIRAYTQSTQSAMIARALFGLFFILAALISVRF
ncbi:MAG: CPBP family glutamic-type intramembrane protease [Chloroflexota bacterium]